MIDKLTPNRMKALREEAQTGIISIDKGVVKTL